MVIDVSVIIVSYNSGHVLADCLDSLSAFHSSVSYEVIVVDNHGADGVAEMLKNKYPEAIAISQPVNKGFAAGANLGLSAARGRYCLLLNPDTLMIEDSLTSLVRFMDEHPRAGIAGCRLIAADGKPLVSLGRSIFSRLETAEQDIGKIAWVTGAAMILRADLLTDTGRLDEDFFFEGEDADYCMRAGENGWEIWFTAVTSIVHLEGESCKRPNGLLYFQRRRGDLKLLSLYGNIWQIASWRIFNLSIALLSSPFLITALLVRFRQEKVRNRIAQGLLGYLLVGRLSLTPSAWLGFKRRTPVIPQQANPTA